MKAKIVLLPGDGIGVEVLVAARAVMERVAELRGHQFHFEEAAIGGAALDTVGIPLPEATLELCKQADAALLGAVGGPSWSHLRGSNRPEEGLLRIRQELGLFANLRPVPVFPALIDATPLKPHLLEGVNILVVRELTGGIYFGPRQEGDENQPATDTMLYSVLEVERIAHVAFLAARARQGHVTSVDKANVLATSRLWRRTVDRVAEDYPDVELRHLLVDACAMALLRAPAEFDVILTTNMFGDILSDEASMLSGSLGMLPSACLGEGRFGLFEPVHGSAPDVAGSGTANPIGAILSAAMLMRHSLDLEDEARAIEKAVEGTLSAGLRTADLCREGENHVSTRDFTEAIIRTLE